MNNNLIIVFVRTPELGKVKTRLAKAIGDQAALTIYKLLLKHTATVLHELSFDKVVYYSEKIENNDFWKASLFEKKLQKGADLGERMQQAFETAFDRGYKKVLIIGSDLFELTSTLIISALEALETYDISIGPSLDGGYYLLGMKELHPAVFKNKKWGTDSVLENTLQDLKQQNVKLLEALNDIDTFEDLQQHPELLNKI
ncbi:TIGR04282 family arsenosugar biosynthesis glycosyltransferase [Flavobacteriaceae bacterium]|jgi:rSAM/selenodomain-associated transferase 1|nr:TIGR04282 family arsenosugar biosynthesis glycosyltransferase [Flavobacteriaceae bacterium]MDC3198875.1 TIGR04282 family arsenosugar biosynthesis glycosyltransferase [Flavobacteriaceae bacterium]